MAKNYYNNLVEIGYIKSLIPFVGIDDFVTLNGNGDTLITTNYEEDLYPKSFSFQEIAVKDSIFKIDILSKNMIEKVNRFFKFRIDTVGLRYLPENCNLSEFINLGFILDKDCNINNITVNSWSKNTILNQEMVYLLGDLTHFLKKDWLSLVKVNVAFSLGLSVNPTGTIVNIH